MKFRPSHNSLTAGCEEAARFLRTVAGMDVVELFSLEGIRTLQQNRKMWPLLTDISKQVEWYGEYHSADTWKHILSAAYRNQVFVKGVGDSLVAIPLSTSKLRKAEFAELIECIFAFGAEKGVRWGDPALKTYQEYREAA